MSSFLYIPATKSAPTISGTLAISGNPIVSQVLTASGATASGTPSPSTSYQWYRGSTAISGATTNTYTLLAVDAGENIWVEFIATNIAGEAKVKSSIVAIFLTLADKYPPAVGANGWSTALLKGSYYSSPILRVRKTGSAPGSGTDIYADPTTGFISAAQLSAACTGSIGLVEILYDQLGGKHLDMSALADASLYSVWTGSAFYTQNSKPTLFNSNGSRVLSTTDSYFDFLHDTTTFNYSLLAVMSVPTSDSVTVNIISTMASATAVVGLRVGIVTNRQPQTTSYAATGGALVISAAGPNNSGTGNALTFGAACLINAVFEKGTSAGMRIVGNINRTNIGVNGQGGAYANNPASAPFRIGGNVIGTTGSAHQLQLVMLYRELAPVLVMRTPISSVFNLNPLI